MKHLPPIGKATAAEIAEAMRSATKKETPQRIQLFRNSEYNRLYMQNEQWLEEAMGVGGVTGANGQYQSPFLQPMVDGDDFAPRPVHNEMLPIIQNEVARVVGAGSQITVPPNDSGSAIKEAAKLAQDVLRSQDNEINFKALKMRFVRSQCTDGLGIFISEQQTDYGKTMKMPKPVMGCTDCSWFASVEDHENDAQGAPLLKGAAAIAAARRGAPTVNFQMANFNGVPEPTGLFGLGDEQPAAVMDRCPECGGVLTSRPAGGHEDQDYDGNDAHKEIPVGDIFVGTMKPMDWFPAANGRLDPDGSVRRWASEEIVSLDYIAQFYEDGYKVKPDTQELTELHRWHPQGFEDGTYVSDTSLNELENHAVLRRMVRMPYFEVDDKGNRKFYDKGRFTVMAGKIVLIDDVLMLEDERSDTMVPRCKVHFAPWEPISGSAWGNALATYLRSPQDNENTAFAQAIEARHDWSSPKMWLGPGQNIEFLGQAYGNTANSVYRWTGGAEPPLMRTGVALNEQWKFEVQEYQAAQQRIASSRDVENGNAPSGVTAAQALRLLAEAATVTRQPRIALTVAAIESLGKHRLQLMGILYKEPRDFKAGGRGDRMSIKQFKGLDLMGQCDVKVNIEPFVESAVLKSQAAAEALANQTLVLRTAGDRARYLQIQGVPEDIAPGEGLQVETAADEWLKFIQHRDEDGETVLSFGTPPVVKEDFDNNEVHAEQHTIDLMSWEGDDIRENWDPIALALAGWKDDWDKLMVATEVLKTSPPGEYPPMPAKSPITGTVNTDAAKASLKAWMTMVDIARELEALPALPELRIFEFWKKRLAKKSIDVADPKREKDLALIRWLAHIEGHRYEIKKSQQALMPAAPVSAPETTSPVAAPGGQAPGMVA